MEDDLDPKYLSENNRQLISEVRKELIENPVTQEEIVLQWVRVNITLPIEVAFLRFKLWLMKGRL